MSSPDGHSVSLHQVTKTYGSKTVLDQLDLELHDGELLALLGPSGCGKTTSLRILAGFETPTSGRIEIDGDDVTSRSVQQRGMGVVFQAYSLFPHMTALENVGYGLRIRGARPRKRAQQALELLEQVGLADHRDKFPGQMSGGQQQRVALARALAIEPGVLLLDEPLSALDAQVRVQLRSQIRELQQRRGTTTLLVTHDQEEALTMADRVGVMNRGRIEQLATPADVYAKPVNAFVSSFVGVVNRLEARVDGARVQVLGRNLAVTNTAAARTASGTSRRLALVRPEDLAIAAVPDGAGTVTAAVLRGSTTSLTVAHTDQPDPVRVDVSSHEAVALAPGTRVQLVPRRDEVLLDDGEEGD